LREKVNCIGHQVYVSLSPEFIPEDIDIEIPSIDGNNDKEPWHSDNPQIDDPLESQ
jgi:hypothetical protein